MGTGRLSRAGPESTEPPPRRSELEARLVLRSLPGVGDRTYRRVLRRFGRARTALDAPAAEFDRVTAPGTARLRRGARRTEGARRVLDRCREVGAGILVPDDRQYPAGLRNLDDPPPLLFHRGDLGLLERPCVTIVGSRKATAYGRRIAEGFAGELASAGMTVVSGLALGVDGAAHEGALRAGGGTAAVLGTGIDRPYPRSHRRLFHRIAREGLLLSEFSPGTPPEPHHFPRRNRILAALPLAVLVVEAGRRSGALITARHALDLGLLVFAVPGPVDRPESSGANRLLLDGAWIATRPADVVDVLTRFRLVTMEVPGQGGSEGDRTGAPSAGDAKGGSGEAGSDAPLSEDGAPPGDQGVLWAHLRRGPLHIDQLGSLSGLPPSRFLAALSMLEVTGRVHALPGGRYTRAGLGTAGRVRGRS